MDVLTEDRDLAGRLPASHRSEAQSVLWAPCLEVKPGDWQPPPQGPSPGIGLLVLQGLLTRDIRLAGGSGTELLGSGDVLRPWDDDRAEAPIPPVVAWRVLEPVRLAVLDQRFTQSVCAWPELVLEFHSRLLRRARWLACLLALSDIRRLEPRLLALLWLLADRWGAVEREGVTLTLPLTHRTLGDLIGAERPSVTRSLQRLQAAGAISARADGGWILHGDALEQVARTSAAVTVGTGGPLKSG